MNRRDFGRITLGGTAATICGAAAAPTKLSILVPAYFYPAGPGRAEWDRMIASARQTPITAIVNPASGPGNARDANYVSVLEHAIKSQLNLIGYVSTHYAEVPLTVAKSHIDRWISLYPQIRGFFFDEQASNVTKIGYYSDLAAYARSKSPGAQIVANPGTTCDEAYIDRKTSDVACLFENTGGMENYNAPAWAKRYPSSRFAVIPYAITPVSTMRQIVQKSATKRYGVVYVTDGNGQNPYDRLPSYWDAEVKAVAAVNAS
jgi:hypothetical protein